MGNYLNVSTRRRTAETTCATTTSVNLSPSGEAVKSTNLLLTTVQGPKRSVTTTCSKKTTASSHASSSSENEMERLRLELREAKRQVYEREQQLLKLHREIHKLRSVLDHSEVINALKPSLSMTMLLTTENSKNKSNIPNKKQGVSGESYAGETMKKNINFVWKDFDCRRIIQEALLDNSFLKNYLNSEQLDMIVNSMYEKEFGKNCYICRRGTYGSHLYVITYGQCEVIDSRDKPVNQIGPGKAFGELALLYNCTRTASVKTLTRVRTWVLDRKVFQMIMVKTCLDRTQSIQQFLKSVPLLKHLNDEKIGRISDVIEVDYYPQGEYICRQGSFGDSFYIISKGTVRVTQVRHMMDKSTKNGILVKEETIRTLGIGDYFGEQALLLTLEEGESLSNSSVVGGATRTANVISEDCECLVLDQANFFNLLGDLNEIRFKSYNDTDELVSLNDPISKSSSTTSVFKTEEETTSPSELKAKSPLIQKLTLDELENVAQLGMGGFGIVNLVRIKSNPNQVFALKRCSKEFVRTSHQQQHIINEKLVMQRVSGRHQFIIQLYRTFKDAQNVYFLIETALGGELWTVLRQRGPFKETAARFYLGCVIEALQYLHANNIIYRDLKPENCLLDADGYLKLTDFGFSKFLQPAEKTWTFCGTPEYVAPEIILNRGHDKSVDIWSLGILLYELLTGIPPFASSDPLDTYHIILRGFDSIGFDENVFSKHCVNLIRNLCKENPNERLGVRGRNGYLDIKRHKWFTGFNWSNLVERKLVPPIVPQLSSNIDVRYFDTEEDSLNGNAVNRQNKFSGSRKPSRKISNPSANISDTEHSPAGKLVEESSPLYSFDIDWENYF